MIKTIPILNPLQFYKENGKIRENNLSFQDYTSKTLNQNVSFKQSFQDKTENIYYKDIVTGEYGFSDSSNFETFDSRSSISYGVAVLDGYNNYEINALDNHKIIIKLKSSSSVQVSVFSNGVSFYSDDRQFSLDEPIILDTTAYDLAVQINGECEVYGIAIVENGDEYFLNDVSKQSELINISEFGAVYLMSTQETESYLPTAAVNDEYSDVIRKYAITVGPTYDDRDNLRITLSNGVVFEYYNNAAYTNLPTNFNDRIEGAYDWISFSDASITLIVEIAHYELVSVEQFGSADVSYNVTLISQRNDPYNWYLSDGISEDFINSSNAFVQEVSGAIRAKKELDFNQYRNRTNLLGVFDSIGNFDYEDISTFPVEVEIENGGSFAFGASNNEVLILSKTALKRNYGLCNQIKIDDFKSELFEILTESQAKDKQLINFTFSNYKDDLKLSFSGWVGSVLMPFVLSIPSSEDVSIFNGQQKNIIKAFNDDKIDYYENTKSIPLYLQRKLLKWLSMSDLTINEIDYVLANPPSSEQIEKTTFYNISFEVRESEYKYINN